MSNYNNEIVTAYFPRSHKYVTLLKVFEKSAYKYMPKCNLKILRMKKPKNIDHKRDTAYAFIAAANYALKSNKNLIITDCDMMFTGDIRNIWKQKFDIAVTVRPNPKYNTGVWCVRPTSKTKRFLKLWIKNTEFIMRNFKQNLEILHDAGGIDQASLAMTVNQFKNINLKELSCIEWNACQTEWHMINSKTKIIHIKSKLRLACFGGERGDKILSRFDYLKPIVNEWRTYL